MPFADIPHCVLRNLAVDFLYPSEVHPLLLLCTTSSHDLAGMLEHSKEARLARLKRKRDQQPAWPLSRRGHFPANVNFRFVEYRDQNEPWFATGCHIQAAWWRVSTEEDAGVEEEDGPLSSSVGVEEEDGPLSSSVDIAP